MFDTPYPSFLIVVPLYTYIWYMYMCLAKRQYRQLVALLDRQTFFSFNTFFSRCRHTAKKSKSMVNKYENDICIYNFVSSPENPLTWAMFSKTLMHHILHRPTVKTMWYPTLIIQTSMFLHKLTVLILHYLPAFLLDLAFIASGKKLRSVIGRSFRGGSILCFYAV